MHACRPETGTASLQVVVHEMPTASSAAGGAAASAAAASAAAASAAAAVCVVYLQHVVFLGCPSPRGLRFGVSVGLRTPQKLVRETEGLF